MLMILEACTTLSTLHKKTKQMRIPSGDNRNLDDQSKHKDNSFLQTSGIQTSISDSEMKRRQHYTVPTKQFRTTTQATLPKNK